MTDTIAAAAAAVAAAAATGAGVGEALPQVSLGLSLGAIEIGVLLASALYGASTVQVYLYASQYANDRRWIQLTVAFVWLLETLHTAFVWMYLYSLTVTGFGNPLALNNLPWYFDASIAMQAMVGASVQSFFTYRVHVVSGKFWLAVPAYAGQLFRAALGIAIAGLTFQAKLLTTFRAHHSYMVYLTLIASVVMDVYNTTALCFYLRSRKSAYSTTTSAIHRIVLWSIETGLVTTTCAVMVLIFWATMPGNGLWVSVLMIYAKLYSNSLLVSLNSRGQLRSTTSGVASSGVNQGLSNPVLITRTYNVDMTGPGESVLPEQEGAVPLEDLSGKNGFAFDQYR